MLLDDVPVPAALALLEHIAGGGQVTHDRVGTPLSDAERGGDFAQTHPAIVRDAQQCSTMIGQETPFRCHVVDSSNIFRVVCY